MAQPIAQFEPSQPSRRFWRKPEFWLVFALYTTHCVFNFGYRYLDYVARAQARSWLVVFYEEFTGVYSAFTLFWLIVLPATRRWRFGRRSWLHSLGIHLACFLVYTAAHTSLMWLTRGVTYLALGVGHYNYGAMRVRYAMEGSNDLLSYLTLVLLITLFDHYRASQQAQIRAAQIEQKLAQAQLDNLRLQLQPHFLFNALNTISSVMYENPRVADRMITSLSDLLRASLRNTKSEEIRLEDEVRFVEAYLSIMRVRFEDRLRAEVLVEPVAADCLVPPLLLQPLVENAIRYGAEPLSNIVRVQLSARRENGSLRIQIRDWGPGIPDLAKLRPGVGIGHTRTRLEQTYGSKQKFQIENGEDGGVLVHVEIPFHTDWESQS